MPVDAETLEQILAKICSSSIFARSPRLQRFLTYVAKWSVEHPEEPLKEYVIAVAVYDKSVSFDPSSDPIVRVEASRLRSRLVGYYAGPGCDDPLIVELPKGGYTVLVRPRPAEWRQSNKESIAIIPLLETSEPDSQYLANGIAEGITRRMGQIPNLKVAPWTMVLRLQTQEHNLVRTAEDLGVRTLFILRLIVQNDICEIHTEWIDPQRKEHLWGARYDRKLDDLHDLEDEIASDLAERITPHLAQRHTGEIRKQYTTNGKAYELY